MEPKFDAHSDVRHEENAELENHNPAHGKVETAHFFQGRDIKL